MKLTFASRAAHSLKFPRFERNFLWRHVNNVPTPPVGRSANVSGMKIATLRPTLPGCRPACAQAPSQQESQAQAGDQVSLSASAPSGKAAVRTDSEAVALEAAGAAVGGPTSAALKLLVIGPPGSGKSTQGKAIAKDFGIPHVSTGSLLRAEVEAGTELGREIAEQVANGIMVPDKTVVTVLQKRLAQDDAQQGFILDGFPRTPEQLPIYDELFPDGMPVLAIDVEDDEVRRRLLSRGRKDDTAEVIDRRLAIYHEQTAPLLTEFAHRGQLHRVDGNGDIEQTQQNVRDLLNEIL